MIDCMLYYGLFGAVLTFIETKTQEYEDTFVDTETWIVVLATLSLWILWPITVWQRLRSLK